MSEQKAPGGQKEKRFKIGYGVKVPILTLEASVDLLEDAGNSIGFEGTLDDLSRMAGNTPTSSVFTKKVSTLKNYGLIGIVGDQFSITELGQRIVNPTSPEQRSNAILESFIEQDIPRAIYEKYKGKLLPERTFLGNFINKDLDIPHSLKLDWADYFIAAATYAGILHNRDSGGYQVMGRPWSPTANQAEVDDQPAESLPRSEEIVSQKPEETSRNGHGGGVIETSEWGILNQRRVSRNRKAIFAIPDELTKDDIEAIRKILGGVEASLDGLLSSQENSVE